MGGFFRFFSGYDTIEYMHQWVEGTLNLHSQCSILTFLISEVILQAGDLWAKIPGAQSFLSGFLHSHSESWSRNSDSMPTSHTTCTLDSIGHEAIS